MIITFALDGWAGVETALERVLPCGKACSGAGCGQDYCAATVSKLDAILSRFILMPMSFDTSRRLNFVPWPDKYQSYFRWQDFST